ncbi:membrane fusion protein, Cu(I)/Ag(I) efflux system [Catalinimonas alkaloidigena]|uniref:Membrane fusion protein, Cu(I)/Ag(I) efflux system n=1 Tax=Catalinimonas alkaloidigena TaxID=1075417 RepID=A0A1G9JEU3_9BACT|nr:DUF3347 domain-containing protein [Catalinimonas alkaloidigena]SDL35673.1 membrane fusion protein, Cu(I)/Ag(I) efflux system [Catalinimonas alkaloidigena]
MKKAPLFFLLLLLGGMVASCDQPRQQAAYENEAASDEPQKLVDKDYPGFQGELYKVVENYLLVKDALVESDSVAVRDAADGLRRELVDSSIDSLDESQQEQWLDIKEKLDGLAEQMAGTDNLEEQRTAFSQLSQELSAAVKEFHLPEGETLYQQYCPMAFDNEGAFWLSSNEKIRNPYFGDQMLECGRVDETLTY